MMHALRQVSKQWIARAISLAVVGPLCASIAAGVLAPDGSHHTTFLTGHSTGGGAIALLTVLGLALMMGIVIARLVDRREGLLNLGFVFGWVAWTMGRMGEMFRIAPESGTLINLAFEGLVLTLLVLIGLVLMTNPNKGSVMGHQDDISRFDLAYLKESLSKREGLVSLLAAMGGALVIAVLFGRTDLPGQGVGVGFGAGIVGGLAGALAANSARDDTQKNVHTPFAPIIIGVMLCAAVGPMIGLLKPGAGELLSLVVKGELPGYLIMSPMAWVMGALLGVPVGHSWVEQTVQQASSSQHGRSSSRSI